MRRSIAPSVAAATGSADNCRMDAAWVAIGMLAVVLTVVIWIYNRLIADRNLAREGFPTNNQPPFSPDHQGVFHCGDIMLDNSLYYSQMATERSTILQREGLEQGKYILVTIHRDNNTDNAIRLTSIFEAIVRITEENNCKAAIPLHPRTSNILEQTLPVELYTQLIKSPKIKLLPPASYFDMIMLEKNAQIVLTDSGGVQKEAYFFGKPCIIARSETEWTEIVENHAGILTDADLGRIIVAYETLVKSPGIKFPPIFGDGHAAEFICNQLINNHNK